MIFRGILFPKSFRPTPFFDYAPAYYHYKQLYEKPPEIPSPTFQNAAFQDKNTHKIYSPDGKLLFTSQTEITGGHGSFFRTNAGQFQNGLLDIRGKEILKPEYVTIDIQPNGTIYAQSSTKKDGLYDLRGNLLIDTATYENLTPLHPGYLLAKDSVEWALADDGSIIIPQSVQQISRFSSGHFYVQRNDTVLIFDPFGKLILQSNISRCDKINQLLALKEQGKWALALPSGDQKTPFQFDTISNVREYYACYSEAGIVSYHFDKQQFQYFGPGEVLHDMNDHWLKKAKIIQTADGKKGIYKAGGREMIPCIFDQIVLGYQAVFVSRRGDSCTVFTNDFEKIGSFIADSVQEMTYYHNLIIFQRDGVRGIFNPWNGKQLLTDNRRIQVFTDLVFASGNNTATVYSTSNFEPVLPDEIDAMPPKVYGAIEFSGQYIVSKNGKYGMIDTTGQVVVPFQYDQIYSDFFTGILTMTSGQTTDLYIPHSHKIFKSEGCSLHEARPFSGYYVANKTFTGFIDYHLDWVIPLKYNYLQLIDRVGFRACSGSLFGALSLKGDTIVPFEYAQLSYSDTSKKWTGEKPEPCRITLAGGRRVMIPEADKVCGDFNNFTKVCKFAIHTYFSNGKAQAVTSTTYGLVSKVSRKIILPIEYEDIKILSSNSIYLTKAAEQDHKKYAGLMDSTGNWLITPDSLLLDYVPSGFIGCTPGKKYGLFDRNGVLLLPLVYDEIKSWDYYKHVIVRKGKNWAIATGDGTLITPFEFDFIGHADQRTRINAVKNGKWGYIDKTGKEVVPFQYTYADEFNGNWSIILTPEGYRLLNIDGTLHEAKPENRDDFFSQSITYRTDTLPDGITATHLIAEQQITLFSARQIRVTNVWRGVVMYEDLSKNNGETPHFGLLDYAGKQLCPPVYDEIDLDYSNEGPGLHLCRKGKLWGYIDFDGREVIAPQFEHADRFWNGKARVTRNRQRLLIDITGNILK